MKLIQNLITIGLAVATAGQIHAAGFHTGQSGASFTGQGQTGITFFDNAGLVAQNPAAIVKLEVGSHVYGGAARYQTNFTYEDFDGNNQAETIHSASVVPHFYGLYNAKDWAIGTGIYFPFNSGTEWPDTWKGRNVLTKSRLATMNQPLVGSYSFGDFSVGGGVNFIAAQVTLENYADKNLGVKANLGGKGTATGWNASALYDAGNIAAALVYNSAYMLSGEGKAQFDTSSSPTLATTFADGDITVNLNYPSLLELAGSYKSFTSGDGYQSGAYAIEIGILQSGWSAFDEIVIKYDKQLPASETVLEQNWEDVIDYKVGGFYSMTDYLKIRSGYYRATSPIPESTLGPFTPDGVGRNSFYLGAGYKRRAFLMDLAYIISDTLPSETRTNLALPGKYDGEANVLQLSAGYSF
jgi:long-chain fatty acid transport protein